MFPSGRWRGYWEQAGWGQQAMDDLVLRFEGGSVVGAGRDCIGAFTFTGTHDDQGRLSLVKQYEGRHQVLYEGTYDGEGTVFGRWAIPPLWEGTFALSPVQAAPPPDAPIQDL